MAREMLKSARNEKKKTQQEISDYLGISLRYYQKIESGDSTGSFWVWDALEDYLEIHQRKLREISDNHLARATDR